ncbi:MAG: cell division protein FtsQ/DivIB [Chromatiales bacterium]|nr:MAG: cell division protein FtsQ/DivIB [Chromatiales bacterium]
MAGRPNRRRKAAPKPRVTLPKVNWTRVVGVLAAGCVTVAVYVCTVWLMDRPITAVSVQGPFEHVSAMQLEEALADHLHHGFLSTDLGKIQRAATNLPWVATASVQRRWPGTLVVHVTEQQPAACWGDVGLLNDSGELFVKDQDRLPAELPRLNGPDGAERRVAAMYFKIETQLEQRGFAALSLDLDARGAWTFRLNNGVVVRLGAEAVEQRLARFFRALDTGVAVDSEQVAYVDMRYTHGFAIGWRARPAQAVSGEAAPPNV